MESTVTSKRSRAASISSDNDGDASASKLARTPQDSGHKLICTLPPTCSPPNHPSHLLNSNDLERHYALYHAHVCEVKGCNCVFPEERFLELHHTECHDSLAQIKQERGEKIFACFLPKSACLKSFLTPKARRLHLISAHGYPKQYFFAVTNKGIGGLLRKWGEGATMLRGEWTPRTEYGTSMPQSKKDIEVGLGEAGAGGDSKDGKEKAPEELAVRTDEEMGTPDIEEVAGADCQMEDLTTSLQSLALVPDKIRFGRGGKQRGFVRGGRKARGVESVRQVENHGTGEGGTQTENQTSHRNRLDVALRRANVSVGETGTDRTEANFVVVNSRGRGRGRIYIPSRSGQKE